MDKIKRGLREESLQKSLILYVIAFTLTALGLCCVTAALCNAGAEAIRESRPFEGERYYLTNEAGEQLGEGVLIGDGRPVSEREERLIALLELLPVVTAPVYAAVCIMAAAFLFYRNKLKKPFDELKKASEKIARNELNFTVSYKSKDEAGQLCAAFETMRSALEGNFAEMWRQMEERGRLNAAFAHELRTPLTVLKGYCELLQAQEDERTASAASTMGRHIRRLEQYVAGMSRLRRLEDACPEYRAISADFPAALRESAEVLCVQADRELDFQAAMIPPGSLLDEEFVSEVYNNLISNAVRYSRTRVEVSLSEREGGLLLTVSDDGDGFTEEGLRRATDPYYTQEKEKDGHFGLGLCIAKMLCERHGGDLRTENLPEGARVTAFFKYG